MEYPKQREPKKQIEMNTDLLTRIKKIRTDCGLRQADFYDEKLKDIVEKERTSQNGKAAFVSDLENGKAHLTPSLLKRYADIGGCSIDYLVTGEGKAARGKDTVTYADYLKILNCLSRLQGVSIRVDRDDMAREKRVTIDISNRTEGSLYDLSEDFCNMLNATEMITDKNSAKRAFDAWFRSACDSKGFLELGM